MVGRAFRLSWDSTMSCVRVDSTMACEHVDAPMHRVAGARSLGWVGLVGRHGGRLFVCRGGSRPATAGATAAAAGLGAARAAARQRAQRPRVRQ